MNLLCLVNPGRWKEWRRLPVVLQGGISHFCQGRTGQGIISVYRAIIAIRGIIISGSERSSGEPMNGRGREGVTSRRWDVLVITC